MMSIMVKLSFQRESKISVLKTICHDVVEYQLQRERIYELYHTVEYQFQKGSKRMNYVI